jgi:hypothetical protein
VCCLEGHLALALEPAALELVRQGTGRHTAHRNGRFRRPGGGRPLTLSAAKGISPRSESEELFLERRSTATLRVGLRPRSSEQGREMLNVRPGWLRKLPQSKPFPGRERAGNAVIRTRDARDAHLEPFRVERNAAELAASLVQPGLPMPST